MRMLLLRVGEMVRMKIVVMLERRVVMGMRNRQLGWADLRVD
jgi:hypothetical protein